MSIWPTKPLRIALFGLLLFIIGCSNSAPTISKPPELTITSAHPVLKSITSYDEFTGRTEAVGMVEVRSRASGYLNKVAFVDGTEVKKGDLLFEIDPRPFVAEVERTQAKLSSDEAKLRELTAEYARNKALHDRRAVSLEELQQSEAARDVAAANINGTKAEIAKAKLDLEFTRVVAPVSGRISRAEVREGNLISAQASGSAVLTTIVPQSPIYVYFDVDERRLIEHLKQISSKNLPPERIKEANMPVDLGLSNSSNFSFHGSIDFADNQVNASTGTMKIRAVFENPKRLLTPGMFARVRIPEQSPHQAVLIPDMAILTDQNLKYVWLVDSSGSVSRRTIKLGQVTQGLREVASGLKAEDEIVIIGIQKVREGAKVSTKLVTFDDLGQVVQGDSAKEQASNKAAESAINDQATPSSAPAK